MAQKLRHVGKLKGSDTRVVVVFMQLPDDPTQALVIKTDSLPDVDRQELLALVSQETAQKEKDFANALHKAGYLQHFHEKNFLHKVNIDDVIMVPVNGESYPLRDVVNSINESEGLPSVPNSDNLSTANPFSNELRERAEGTNDRKNVARNILYQAHLLEQEAQRKRAEAYKLDPTLNTESNGTAVNKTTNKTKAPAKRTTKAKSQTKSNNKTKKTGTK